MDPYTLLDFRLDPDPCIYGNEYRTLGILSEAFLFYFQIGSVKKKLGSGFKILAGSGSGLIEYGSETLLLSDIVKPLHPTFYLIKKRF